MKRGAHYQHTVDSRHKDGVNSLSQIRLPAVRRMWGVGLRDSIPESGCGHGFSKKSERKNESGIKSKTPSVAMLQLEAVLIGLISRMEAGF